MKKRAPTTGDVLRRARSLLRRGWIQNTYAMANGSVVNPENRNATEFCLSGALIRAFYELKSSMYVACHATDSVQAAVGASVSVVQWNDIQCRTKEQVIALLDKVIARLKTEKGATKW